MNIADTVVEPPELSTTTEYVPPTLAAARQLAHRIGQMLAERRDQSSADVDEVEDFAGFLALVGKIYAKRLNCRPPDSDQNASAG